MHLIFIFHAFCDNERQFLEIFLNIDISIIESRCKCFKPVLHQRYPHPTFSNRDHDERKEEFTYMRLRSISSAML